MTVQRTRYYPSGLPWEYQVGDSASLQSRKYGGKEFVEIHGLDMYDSQARWYDPRIMRTTTPDPLAEKYYSISPYAWCGNNPVNWIDPDGKQVLLPPLFGAVNPMILGTNTPLLGASDVIKVGVETGNKTGLTRIVKYEDHHLIPRSLKDNPVVKSAKEGGFKLEGKENKLQGVEKFSKVTGEGRHAKHPKYTEQIRQEINRFVKENPDFTPKQAANKLTEIGNNARNVIKNNPDTKINDLKLNEIVLPVDNTQVVTSPILE